MCHVVESAIKERNESCMYNIMKMQREESFYFIEGIEEGINWSISAERLARKLQTVDDGIANRCVGVRTSTQRLDRRIQTIDDKKGRGAA